MAYQVVANSVVYTVVDDCATTLWAVVTGRVTDEALGEFTAPGLAVEFSRDDLGYRTADKGLYAITASLARSFPQLSSTSYPLNFTLTAPGFDDFPVSLTIPAGSPCPVSALTASMRRTPVLIQGRVVNATTRAPIANATVLSVDDPVTPPSVHATALRTPLSVAHTAAASLQAVTFATSGSTTLQDAFLGGTEVLNLLARTGLAANSIVRISNATKTQVEYGIVASLGPGPAGSAGLVYLRNPLNRSYPIVGSTVEVVTATLAGAAVALSTDARAGDGIVLAPQLFTSALAIDSASPALIEYREVGAITDADGYYSLAGIGRLQEMFLKASAGALNQTQGWYLDYGLPTNIVDFRL